MISRNFVGDRAVTIKEIKNKYLYRMHDVLRQWQLRFPENDMLQQFHTDTDALEETFINPMLKMLSAMRENVRFVDDIYRSGFVSTGLMSSRLGRSVFQVMGHLVSEADLFVNCAHVDAPSFAAALEHLRSCDGVVVDATAVATLRMLGLEDVLARIPCKVGYATPLLNLVASEAKSPDDDERTVGTMTEEGDRLAFVTQSAQELQAIRSRWAQTLEYLRAGGVLVAAAPLASLNPEDRKGYVDIVGEESAHAASAAREGSFLYWTDDRVNAFLASHYHHVERVWTQAVLAWLSERGVITEVQYRHASARLIAFHYGGTVTGPDVLADAGMIGDWDPRSPVLARNLAHVGMRVSPDICVERLVRYCMAVCLEVKLESNRNVLVIQALESVRHRPELNGMLRALVAQLMARLRMHPFRAHEVQATISAWARAHPLA